MSLCAACGLRLSGTRALCPHHDSTYGDNWAKANRLMCDFFHRKKEPPPPLPSEIDAEDSDGPIINFNRYYRRVYPLRPVAPPPPRRPARPVRPAAFNVVGASWEQFREGIEQDRRRLWLRDKPLDGTTYPEVDSPRRRRAG